MLKFRGTSIYPQSICDALNKVEDIKAYVVKSYTNETGTDKVRILVGCHQASDQFESYLKDYLQAKLRVIPALEFKTVSEIQQIQFSENTRKPIAFLDNRASSPVLRECPVN